MTRTTSSGLTRLLFVRHGRAVVNEAGVIGGPNSCTGLSDLGRRQTQALLARLEAHPVEVDVVLTSVLPRAIETAAILAPVLGGSVAAQDCELCELHPGEADGMTWLEWLERYDFDPRVEVERELAPGAESMITFARRARTAVDRVATEHAGRSVALVVHGGLIVAGTLHLLGFDESVLKGDRALWLEPDNTSLTEWRRDDATGRWTLLRFNDAAHLEGLAPSRWLDRLPNGVVVAGVDVAVLHRPPGGRPGGGAIVTPLGSWRAVAPPSGVPMGPSSTAPAPGDQLGRPGGQVVHRVDR